jgi:hypothetical protein
MDQILARNVSPIYSIVPMELILLHKEVSPSAMFSLNQPTTLQRVCLHPATQEFTALLKTFFTA